MEPQARKQTEPVADWQHQLEGAALIFGWPGLSSTDVLIFIVLVVWLWTDHRSLPGQVVASAVMVAEAIGAASSRTGRRSLKALVKNGLIRPLEELGNGRTCYVVNNPADVGGPGVVRGDDQRRLEGMEEGTFLSTRMSARPENETDPRPARATSADSPVDRNVRADTFVDKSVRGPAGRQGEPGGETPTNGSSETKVRAQPPLQSSNEQLGSNGANGEAGNRDDDPMHVGAAVNRVFRESARAAAEFDAAHTPVMQRNRLLERLTVMAPNLDEWFASYVASQVLCGAIQEQDLANIAEEMRAKTEAAAKGLTKPILDRAKYFRTLLRKLSGWKEPVKRRGGR